MAKLGLPEPYDRVDELIEAGDLAAGAGALEQIGSNDDLIELLRIKLALAEGSSPPGMLMQRLVQLMRENAKLPGASALYREASQKSYNDGESSLSHSHPPPPIKPRDGGGSG